ncbi:hypothetical protein ACFQZ4_36330 [Catellatospora coxensis]
MTATTSAKTSQAARTSAACRCAVSWSRGAKSADAGCSGAPKSVVEPPRTRSTTRTSPGSNGIFARSATTA